MFPGLACALPPADYSAQIGVLCQLFDTSHELLEGRLTIESRRVEGRVSQESRESNDIIRVIRQVIPRKGVPRRVLDEPLQHLGCALAWYIYDKYTKKNIPVNVIAHGIGGAADP
jgi:hypothetical protein